jgi:hypothetical protein
MQPTTEGARKKTQRTDELSPLLERTGVELTVDTVEAAALLRVESPSAGLGRSKPIGAVDAMANVFRGGIMKETAIRVASVASAGKHTLPTGFANGKTLTCGSSRSSRTAVAHAREDMSAADRNFTRPSGPRLPTTLLRVSSLM